MILRMWKARSDAARMSLYIDHAKSKVFPKVRWIEGNLGAYLCTRELENTVEVIVLTFWESLDAIRQFAGPEPERAVVGPQARAVLTSFDEYVTHYFVVERAQ